MATRAKIASGHVERYKQLLREVSRTLKRHASDLVVQHVATLHLMREGVQARLLSGHYVEPSEVLRLDEALARYMPAAGVEPIKVTLTIVPSKDAAKAGEAAVDGVVQCRRCGWRPLDGDRVTRCYRCGATSTSDHYAPWVSPFADKVIDGEVVKPAPAEAKALPPPVLASPVHPNTQPRVHPPGIHHAVLNGVPARMARSNYSGITPNDGYCPLKHVDFDQQHPLPDVPWPEIK